MSRTLVHVLVSGLLAQGVLFVGTYVALQREAPAVLVAAVVSMNPVLTALLAVMFLGEWMTVARVSALVLGAAAVLAACAGRLSTVGGVDAAMRLLFATRWASRPVACINSGSAEMPTFA